MADPTQPLRDSIAAGLKSIIPSNSPLAQSGGSALTPEALAKMEQEKAAQELKKNQALPVSTSQASKYVSQQLEQPQTALSQASSLQAPQTSQIENLATQESRGAEELIKKADVEASALQKKQTQDAENIQNQIKSTEDVLLEKDQKIKDFKFNDRSLWEKSSTGQKLLLLVGGFLSSASSEGAKAFQDSVQRSIDTDLALQNKKLDSLKESKKLSESLLGQLRVQLGDKEKANMAYQSLIYQKLGTQLDANAAKFKSSIMAQNAKLGAQEAFNKAQIEREKLIAKSAEPKKQGAEVKKRLEDTKSALDAVILMKQALTKGENTFSLVGENPFTLAQNKFIESYGRRQSGGAIGEEERKAFKARTPVSTDSKEMQKKKLDQLEAELAQSLQQEESGKSYFRTN
jgi:hypothetical protein